MQVAAANLSTLVVVPMTSNLRATRFDGCILISRSHQNGLSVDSVALVPQIRAIDKNRLKNKAGSLSADDMARIEAEILSLLGLNS